MSFLYVYQAGHALDSQWNPAWMTWRQLARRTKLRRIKELGRPSWFPAGDRSWDTWHGVAIHNKHRKWPFIVSFPIKNGDFP